MIHIQSPCTCFALCILHISTNTTCNTIYVNNNQRQQSPLFFVACTRHTPTCACPLCAHAQHLPALALPMPARALCLRVFVMLVFLVNCQHWYSAAEPQSTVKSIQGSSHARTRTPSRVGDSSGFILRVIRPQTLCLSVSCFYLHAPCSVLPQHASFCPTSTT